MVYWNECPNFKCGRHIDVIDKQFTCKTCKLEGRFVTPNFVWDVNDKTILIADKDYYEGKNN